MIGSHLIKSTYSAEAALRSYYLRLRKLRYSEGRFLFLAAMPKSGSTFLSNALAKLFGYRHSYFAFAYRNIEQELYLPRLVDAYGQGTVVQQHSRANVPNLDLLQELRITPLVLVRNLFDVLVSVRDHLRREQTDNIPSLYVPASFAKLSEESQLDFIVSYYGPWLISFYVSWFEAERARRLDFMWLTYEDCIQDWHQAILEVAKFHRFSASAGEIDDALRATADSGSTRFNKGVAGRGRQLLTEAQKSLLGHMVAFYPEVDFARLGVSANENSA